MAMNSSNSVGQTINLGSNFEISIKDTFDMIKKIMTSDVEILQEQTTLRPKKSEVERLFSDNSLAKKLISWSPKFSGKEGLEKGLIKTVEWFSNEENLKKYKSEIFNF